mmetsp:Transcript_89427/g.172076  ORF Transcript_89427/g.172076 Transcript_89427/m.172076 type:complete len:301 (+) Transcript_89427:1-903(+)
MWFSGLSEAARYAVTRVKLNSKDWDRRGFHPMRYEPLFGFILNKVLWITYPIRLARFEKLFMLAVASGLKCIGGFSLAYPLKRVALIREEKRGFQVMTPQGLDIMQEGWEMRSLMSFRSLQHCVVTRMFFVLFLKQAVQMNLQITLFNAGRAAAQEEASFQLTSFQDWVETLSIVGLLVTTLAEIVDAIILAWAFLQLRKDVVGKVDSIGHDEIYANPHNDGTNYLKRESFTGKDLKELYRATKQSVVKMLMLVSCSIFLILYAVVKFRFAFSCESGLWQYSVGCLKKLPRNYTCSIAAE